MTNPEIAETLEFEISVADDDGATANKNVVITVNPAATTPPSPAGNELPTVNAGENLSVEQQSEVTLTASASDPDGSIVSYQWTQVNGTPVTINNAASAQASFTAPELSDPQTAETLEFDVLVTDDDGATAHSSVLITVNPVDSPANELPTVNAGDNLSVEEQTEVTLSATANDPDGTIASYEWAQISGSPVTINNATSADASFTAPALAVPEVSETAEFEVMVTDDAGGVATSSVTVTINPPVTLSEDCTLTISPGDSFIAAFEQLSAGELLCLNDGKYQQAMDIPSDIHVRAINIGMAEIDGGSALGEAWTGGLLQMHGSNSSVSGLKVHHAGELADACNISGTNNIMRDMSCSHGGTHKHKLPLKLGGSGHLIENSWFYGEGRYTVQCFQGDHITLRENVIRWDKTIANEPNEPNAAMSNYSCSDMIWENNVSLDYAIPETEMVYCGDMCMSTVNEETGGNENVQYLGNFVVNHSQGTSNNKAFRADQKNLAKSNNILIKDFYVRGADVGIVINPGYTEITIENCTTNETIQDGIYTASQPISCDDTAEVSMKYVDGVKTDQLLFPFANETLIKRDMCASGERQSQWCATDKSLEDYVLNR